SAKPIAIKPSSRTPIATANERRALRISAIASGESASASGPVPVCSGSCMAEDTEFELEGEPVTVAVDEALAGGRLDAVLAGEHTLLSRNRIKDLILNGAVTIDGRPVSEPNYRLKAGETIVLLAPPPEDAEPEAEDIPLDILHEDD